MGLGVFLKIRFLGAFAADVTQSHQTRQPDPEERQSRRLRHRSSLVNVEGVHAEAGKAGVGGGDHNLVDVVEVSSKKDIQCRKAPLLGRKNYVGTDLNTIQPSLNVDILKPCGCPPGCEGVGSENEIIKFECSAGNFGDFDGSHFINPPMGVNDVVPGAVVISD